jgi:hypothetical protein
VERVVVSALANAPGLLDFYIWLVWRSWILNGNSVRIPLGGPGGLNQQLGTKEYISVARFGQRIEQWMARVKAFWPQCPAKLSADRRNLILFSSRPFPAIRAPGVSTRYRIVSPRSRNFLP